MRWLERLERYSFNVCYKKGETIIAADVLSRSPPSPEEEAKEYTVKDKEQTVLEIHKVLSHRRKITKELKDKGILVVAARSCQLMPNKDLEEKYKYLNIGS